MSKGPFHLPALKFAFDALSPVVSGPSLHAHYFEHHRACIESLNAALADHPQLWHFSIEDLLRQVTDVPDGLRAPILDFGGGHANHQFFWKVLAPPAAHSAPQGELLEAVDRDFGSVDAMQARFEAAGAALRGSGWVFLVAHPRRSHRLEILALQDNGSVLTAAEPSPGLLVCDLFEHAYDLDYGQRRSEWLKAFWSIVDWDVVGRRLAGVKAGLKQL